MSLIVTDAPGLSDLARAIQERDAAAQSKLYADDAVLTTIDNEHGPSNPDVARGRDAIGAQLADVCSRDMTHEVAFFVHSGDRAALAVNCSYPDGTRVVCQAAMTLRDGKIAEQTTVQAWDS